MHFDCHIRQTPTYGKAANPGDEVETKNETCSARSYGAVFQGFSSSLVRDWIVSKLLLSARIVTGCVIMMKPSSACCHAALRIFHVVRQDWTYTIILLKKWVRCLSSQAQVRGNAHLALSYKFAF